MSRLESDREDLMREATALRLRGELRLTASVEPVVAGRRSDGRWSIYFGGDPCYHFDVDGRLRRAFVAGLLYRTEGTTLAALQRVRTGEETVLRRRDLDELELGTVLDAMQVRLAELRDALRNGSAQLVRQHPPEGNFSKTLLERLNDQLSRGPRLASAIK
ncbi:MAG: hypothetical protein DWQ34_19785 [Planctomycetota bacterium]|nr:MAG: hypothetical protein DWQ34_19785 [Planctomycetota bacterium]REK28936.1 MAG: hypothetical protein DWQ41_05135 [Planctomycetota bacterium]REK39630.1 MAG: hypothetical protein DWQ45_01810 [Planctomycetota bacterium]